MCRFACHFTKSAFYFAFQTLSQRQFGIKVTDKSFCFSWEAVPFVEKTKIFGESRLEFVTVRLEPFAESYKDLVMSYFVKCHPKEGVSVEVDVDADAVAVPL